MAASSLPPSLDRLRDRFDALPLDRAPLRRAGLLAVLLVALLALGKAFGPDQPPPADRQDVRATTEDVSASPGRASLWTGGRVLALLFLATGGGIAVWLHRRSGGRVAATGSTLEILETHPLGPNHSLRLVACGHEVMLLSVAAEGATLLRHWPRDAFDTQAVSFADALAELTADAPLAVDSLPLTSEANLDLSPSRPASAAPPVPASAPLADSLPTVHTEAVPSAVEAIPASVDERTPAFARGTLFPTRAPRQFDVQHG